MSALMFPGRAVVNDFLGFSDATDYRAGKAFATDRQLHPMDTLKLFHRTNIDQGTIEFEDIHEGLHGKGLRDRGDQQINLIGKPVDRRGITRQHHFARTQPSRIGDLAG